MAEKVHCSACGESVDAYEVDLGGITETRCLRCGLPLQKRAAKTTRFRRILVADDSEFFATGLHDHLTGSGIAGEVIVTRDGAQAVEAVTSALRDRRPPGLAILDLLMPRLNGLHAAVAIRSVERAFGGYRIPILFLSSKRIDPTLRPLLDELAPAYYLNKSAPGGTLLDGRLDEVLSAIASGARKSGTGRELA